jgi:hypothetical protein
MPALPPLASVDDVASRLGRDVSESEAIRLTPLLADASAQIRRYCRPRDFLYHVNDVLILHGHDSEIHLPCKPVVSVASVVAIGGGMGLPDVPIPWFTFDGIDTIRVDPGHGIINLPEVWWADDMYPGTFRVTLTHGDVEVPDDVVMVCANAALSVLTAPTAAAGVIGETIGPYSYRLERGGGGVSVALSAADLAVLKDYRRGVHTLQARLR